MENYYKNSMQKININNNFNSIKKEKIFNNDFQNVKNEHNEIIIELVLQLSNIDEEIYILCDKDELIKNNKINESFYKENNIFPTKEFDYFNNINTKLYLNDEEISFKYKLKFNKTGINKIKIISNIKLFSLSSMFYNCYNINTINFIKINIEDVTDISFMFYNCINLTELNLSSFNTKNVINMSSMFSSCCK